MLPALLKVLLGSKTPQPSLGLAAGEWGSWGVGELGFAPHRVSPLCTLDSNCRAHGKKTSRGGSGHMHSRSSRLRTRIDVNCTGRVGRVGDPGRQRQRSARAVHTAGPAERSRA